MFVSLIVQDNLYFLNNEGLYRYDDVMKEPVIIPSSNLTGGFTGLFEIYGSLYLTSEQEALLKVEGNNLVRTSLGFSVSDEILFVTPGDNHYLIGLNGSRIFLYGNDRVPKQINLQDIKYAQASVIVEGKWLNPQLFVSSYSSWRMIFRK